MFEWKNEYGVEVEEIDHQHQKLLEIGSRLFDFVRERNEDHYDDIILVLAELEDYTLMHFEYEENLLEQHGYAHLQEHKKEHASFVNKVIQLKNQDIDEVQSKVTMDMIVFIADWISKHILKTDHQYKDFFELKGVK